MKQQTIHLTAATLLATLVSCTTTSTTPEFHAVGEVIALLEEHADCIVLRGDGDSRVVVSPRLQGRILTMSCGPVASTGYVPAATITVGEKADVGFNNFGGLDRFWIGPEAGQFGIYFAPGADMNRTTWQVPPDFDRGAFAVTSSAADKVVLERDMSVKNWINVDFDVHVRREVGVLTAKALADELGVLLPEGTSYVGCYSDNTMTNLGDKKWDPTTGLLGIWILGMFNASDEAVVIAPFKTGDDLGSRFNDDYFGKVTEVSPERLKVVDDAVIFRGDARRVGKFGLSQMRTRGMAGSYDFGKRLLTVVQFDVPQKSERYGNSTWVEKQKAPYGGDAFQSYNNGDAENPGELAADPFYELESASPVRPLAPGESVRHRHATFHFQGSHATMAYLAKKLLDVDLDRVRAAMMEP